MKKVVTHDGKFHPYDVFAVATLQLRYGVDAIEVIRTRQSEIIKSADIVADVGREYDPAKLRFDHHQEGAPVRENGIPFAAFGLVWKHFGPEITGSAEVAEKVEERLCQPIDANDNGVSLYTLSDHKVAPIELQNVVFSYYPVDSEDDEVIDAAFMEAVDFAREYLLRYIAKAKKRLVEKGKALAVYESAIDKNIIIADEHISTGDLIDFPEPQVIVSPALSGRWKARVLPVTKEDHFSARVQFPESWAGKEGDDLMKTSRIQGLIFCHKGRHLVFATSKKAAIAAAEQTK